MVEVFVLITCEEVNEEKIMNDLTKKIDEFDCES